MSSGYHSLRKLITKGAIYIVNLIIYANIIIHLLSYAPVPWPIQLSPCFSKQYLESDYEKKIKLESVPHNTSTMDTNFRVLKLLFIIIRAKFSKLNSIVAESRSIGCGPNKGENITHKIWLLRMLLHLSRLREADLGKLIPVCLKG
uniref:Uncharacterized protein n=1 Tax=Glossina palpalis gambiensis TaxID=67801 RepID=A0A1B0ASR1_9MUSC